MKFTKKMIMVPQVEYETLMNMIKGENPLGVEKAETEAEISKVLHNPKLSELVKGKKHDWLVKKRRQLKSELKKEAEKPKKVLLDDDQLKSLKTAVTPRYMGVALTEPQKQSTSRQTVSEGDNYEQAKSYDFHSKYQKNILRILKQNKLKYGINDKNELNGVADSNINEIVEYLTDHSKRKPEGTDILLDKVKNDKWYHDAKDWADWHRQRGEGRRHRQKKTEKFKPLIWARL